MSDAATSDIVFADGLGSSHAVFVYGTLLRGEPNHVLLRGAESLGAATTNKAFVLVDRGPFPGVVDAEHPDRTPIRGELYRVDDAGLAILDRLEGVPHHYQRIRGDVVPEDPAAPTVNAWFYVQPAIDGDPTIPGGDWRDRPGHDETR